MVYYGFCSWGENVLACLGSKGDSNALSDGL